MVAGVPADQGEDRVDGCTVGVGGDPFGLLDVGPLLAVLVQVGDGNGLAGADRVEARARP